jgi:hypothetical protein
MSRPNNSTNDLIHQLFALPACNGWAKNALKEFPQCKWFSDLCQNFHEFHNKSGAGNGTSTDAIDALLTEFCAGDGKCDYSDAPSWMTASENDKHIKSLCQQGMHLYQTFFLDFLANMFHL